MERWTGPPDIGNEAGTPLPIASSQHHTGGSAGAMQQERQTGGARIGREDANLFAADAMRVLMEDPKKSTKSLQELTYKFSEVTGCMRSILKKQLYFQMLATSNWKLQFLKAPFT